MIVYFDTSAIVPIVVAEPSSEICRRLWEHADQRVSCGLAYVEVGAALAAAERQGRLATRQRADAWLSFEAIWPDVHVVELTAGLASRAVRFAQSLALRAYDAVHCAAALAVQAPDVVAASGDARLLDAWRALGVATAATYPPRNRK
ncbi:MAG: type II toxin-antitoxin system VapC family toxin [Bifidobacteriaceae bacterium]|nr:type II toxin-antitoxin system VapC family toxin [Bifidobacteriaceae bacterium]